MPDQIMLRIQSHNVHSTLYNVARSDMIYTVRAGKALLSWQILHISHQSLAHSQPASQKTHKKTLCYYTTEKDREIDKGLNYVRMGSARLCFCCI